MANKCDRECSSGRRRRRSSEAWRTQQRVVLDGHWTGVGRRLDRRRRLPQRPARRVRVAAARHRRRLRLGADGRPAATSPDPGDRRARVRSSAVVVIGSWSCRNSLAVTSLLVYQSTI